MKTRPLLLLVALLCSACEDREIKRYEIVKETETPPGLPAAIVSAKPSWTVPKTWKELPPSGMRAASFTVASFPVDVSIVTFPGTAGGLLANLNRWRGQMGLPTLTVEPNLETLSASGQPAQIVELTSPTEDKAMLGGIFLRDDQSWFLKLTGNKASVAAEKDNFRAFAASFDFQKVAPAKKSTNDG